jgi:hypothetical protein
MQWLRSRWVWKVARWASVPVLVVTLALGVRTAWIGTNDLVHFGRGDRWWCYLSINFWGLNGSLSIYEPGYAPFFGWGTGPFFEHVKATGGTWALSVGPHVDTYVPHDWGIVGWSRSTLGGRLTERGYWIRLPLFPAGMFLVSGAVLGQWVWQTRRARRVARVGLCPKCGYDLRAHAAGQRYPECGTIIERKEVR